MKKILLATVAVAALSGSAFAASMMTSGEVEFLADATDSTADSTADTDNNDLTNLEFNVNGELSTTVSDATKDGLSWSAGWTLDFTQNDDGNGAVTVEDANISVSSMIGTVTMGDTSANSLNDAADALFTNNLETVAVKYSNTFAGFGVALAADDNEQSQWGLTYGMGGLDIAATGYETLAGSSVYAAGVALNFAGFAIALGTDSDSNTAYEVGYTMAGIGMTLAGNDKDDASTIEASYEIASGLTASVTYDAKAEAVSEAGVTVKF